MKKYLLFLFLFPIALFAQKTTLNLVVSAEKNETVDFSTLAIRNAQDSIVVYGDYLKEDGKVTIALKSKTYYWVNISKIGLQPYNQRIRLGQRDTTLTIVLLVSSTKLGEVTVTYKKPLMTQEDDKTIVDAEPLAKLSANAYEVIEKTPGAIVDNDGNIYLGKTEAARVYINGREMKLSSSDLASILKSMPANSIAKIEILRTPSAKYDASSSGGIINIVLKKGVRLGLNGTINGNYFQGKYPKYALGFSINNGTDNTNTYLNYQYNHRNNFETFTSNRFFSSDNSDLIQNSYTTSPTQTHYISTGIDQKITSKLNIAYDFILNKEDGKTLSENQSGLFSKTTQTNFSQNNTSLHSDLGKLNLTNTLTATYKMDTLGSEFVTTINGIFTNATTAQAYTNRLSIPTELSVNGTGDIDGKRTLFTLNSDITKKLRYNFKIETGVKVDFLENKSQSDFFIAQKKDLKNSAAYSYKENINAGYFQVSKPVYGVTIKAGVRAENTNMLGVQTVPSDTSFRVQRTDFFPYLYVRRKLFDLFKGIGLDGNLIVRRSVARPNYSVLNPARQFTDPYYVQQGNPALQPQFTNTYECNISYNEYPVFAIGRDNTKNVFSKVTYQDPQTKIYTETYDNLGTNQRTYLRLVGGIPPGGTYFIFVGAQYNFDHYKGFYQNEALDLKRKSWVIFSYQELKFNKTTNLGLQGFLQIHGFQNFYDFENLGALNLFFNKKFLDQKLAFTLTVNDIFFTNRPKFTLAQGKLAATGERINDTRRVGLSFRYNFGVKTKENNRKNEENVFDMVNPQKKG
ncbi:MAG: hypothetical protein RLZZ292_2022 [Bacteroidota bacterium]|jgi:hypothetical protein